MTTTTTITAYQLAELLRKVDPHIWRHLGARAIQGVRLDCDGRHLHAVATDRCTLAVARQEVAGAGTWSATINGSDYGNHLGGVAAWLDSHQGEDNITLTPGTEGGGDTLTLASHHGTLAVPVYGGFFPDWRGVIRTAMEHPAATSPYTRLDGTFLARWEHAGRELRTWQAAPDTPIIFFGTGFVGVQMPVRPDAEDSLSIQHANWASTLGAGDPVEMHDTLTAYEPEELDKRDNFIRDHAEDLLKLTLRSASDLFSLSTSDIGALTAYSLAGTQSWFAYRLLKALQKADPDLLRSVIKDTDEQLESGEISEWAWDEAEKAGRDPQKWHDDYETHLKKLAEERKQTEAAQFGNRLAAALNAAQAAGINFRIEPNEHVAYDEQLQEWKPALAKEPADSTV